MSYLVGLDIGTSKICALVFDIRKNKASFVLSRQNSSFVTELLHEINCINSIRHF